jgi:hypothetical protein
MRIFFKFNNDNNPFMVATLNFPTIFGGLTIIGGYIKIFGLLKVLLYLYNKRSFENRIFRQYKEDITDLYLDGNNPTDDIYPSKRSKPDKSPIAEYLKSRGKKELDMKTLRNLLSYEMLM